LTSKGSLNWNILNDLCDQNGVVCDSSNPKRVTQLYFSFFLFIFFISLFNLSFKKKKNRNLSDKGLQGTIPLQLISLPYLQNLYFFLFFFDIDISILTLIKIQGYFQFNNLTFT